MSTGKTKTGKHKINKIIRKCNNTKQIQTKQNSRGKTKQVNRKIIRYKKSTGKQQRIINC